MASRRASKATDQLGSTVEHITNTLPGFMLAAQPGVVPSPNNTASVCAALTTTDTTTSHAAPSEARESCAVPPSLVKRLGHLAAHIKHLHAVPGAAQ
jgi:hypothetical protein